jgi:type IV fimbrial biogenesis protein FimT
MDRQSRLLGDQKRRIMRIGSAQHGFTLIEMMIGIAILAILILIGMPGYATWIQNTQIRNATESVLNGMQLARNEAVRRNASVQLALGTQSSWTINAINADSSIGEQIQSRAYGAGSTNVTVLVAPANATKITFNSLGRVGVVIGATTNADGSAAITQLDFNVPTSILADTASRKLRIVVTAGGNVRMCDPAVTDTADTRLC